MKQLPLLLCGIGLSFQSFGQDSFIEPFLESDEQVVESVPAENIRPLPDDAIVKFDVGSAPFYARLKSYSRILNRALLAGQNDAIEGEARLLGLDISNMELLISLLQNYNQKENELWQLRMTQVCNPVLRNEPISSELAREGIRSIDDDIPIRNELAHKTMQEIDKVFGGELAVILTDRITKTGTRLHFSRVDQVKQVEFMQRGDFVGVFTARCKAL